MQYSTQKLFRHLPCLATYGTWWFEHSFNQLKVPENLYQGLSCILTLGLGYKAIIYTVVFGESQINVKCGSHVKAVSHESG